MRNGAAVLEAFAAFMGSTAATRAAGFAAGRTGCISRGDLPGLALAAPAREPAIAALRLVGLATRTTFREEAALRGVAYLAAGLLVFEAFFAGISFSAPG